MATGMTTPSAYVLTTASRSHRIIRHPLLWVGLCLFVGLTLFCFAGQLVYPASAFTVRPAFIGHGPGPGIPLGADELGRNELARLILGGRLLIVVGVVSAAVATIGGGAIGLASGLLGGPIDRVLTWVMDVTLGIPQLVPLLLIQALLRPDAFTMIFVVAATSWPLVARLTRAEAMSVRERDYVTAARSLGASDVRIMFRHILPNVWTTILVQASNNVANSVLVVATASFLGFGLPPPWPNWAGMIATSAQFMFDGYWWLMLFPGLAFLLLQLSINLTAEALRSTYAIHGEVR